MPYTVSRHPSKNQLNDAEWDYIADDHPICPACGGRWKDAPKTYVSEELGVALVNGHGFYVSDEQARILQVLRSASNRWVGIEELLVLAYSDLPDADQPEDTSAIETAVRMLKRRVAEAGYMIQSRRGFGYRLTKRM